MNETVTPKQLELTTENISDELPIQSLDPDIKAELDKIRAVAKVINDADDFNWHDDDSIILREQRAVAVYRNKGRDLVIRQQACWNDDEDAYVCVTPENEISFLEALAKKARET